MLDLGVSDNIETSVALIRVSIVKCFNWQIKTPPVPLFLGPPIINVSLQVGMKN